jgi:hypothetical protein
MKLKYIWWSLIDQGPPRRFLRNLWKGHLIGLFSRRSHYREDGKEKVGYNTKETAKKSADSMAKKTGYYYSNYRCPWCGKFHLGRNINKEKYIQR